jgi:CRP/FNR family transcriptional regulator, cyclic AMP receptor protein
MIPMFVPSRMSLLLLLPMTSGGQEHLHARQKRTRILQHCDAWPGFREQTPHSQWRLIAQRHEAQVPPPAQDTHQPQAGGPLHSWLPGDQDHNEGRLRVSMALGEGLELAQLQAGEVVGEMAFVESRPPMATVTANTDALGLALSRQHVTAKLAQDEGFAARFYHAITVVLADRMRHTVLCLGSRSRNRLTDARDAEEERDPQVVQRMALAGARFDWMLTRLQSA